MIPRTLRCCVIDFSDALVVFVVRKLNLSQPDRQKMQTREDDAYTEVTR